METLEGNGSTIVATRNAGASSASRVWRILTFDERLPRRTAVVLWTAAVVGLGLFSGWGFIVAAGLSSLVLGILPCAAMCALGLCGGSSGKKCSDKTSSGTPGTKA
ncbi:MAG: hypothetical protein ABIR52_10830 [Casimicrobiaceae bacterium]